MAKNLSKALDAIKKKYGKDSEDIIYNPDADVESCSSGSQIIDCVTGTGGFLIKKKLVEIAAPESSGKTTLCLMSCAEAQKKGWVGVFIDVEQAFDYNYARKLGVNLDNETFFVVQPTFAEQAEKVIDIIVDSTELDYIIIDSVAAMKPEAQVYAKDSTGVGRIKGEHAMFWANYSPKLQMIAKDEDLAVLMTNQVRQKISIGSMYQPKAVKSSGIGTGFSQDDSWTTTGGNALKFYLSSRYLLGFRKAYTEENEKKEKVKLGNVITINNVKNKLAAPYTKADFVIRFRGGVGVDDLPIIFEKLKEAKFIEYKGGQYTMEDSEFVKGFSEKKLSDFMKVFRENEEGVKALYKSRWEELHGEEDIDGELADKELIDDELLVDELDD